MKQITKLFASLLVTLSSLGASEQLIVVVSDTFDTPHGTLTRYEKEDDCYKQIAQPITVNLGRNGLGWGIGEAGFTPKAEDPVKKEGDGRSPAGIFKLSKVFGYAPQKNITMPYLHADKDLICIDDIDSKHYNKILDKNSSDDPKSFEWMRRDDNLYKIGVVVEHNAEAKKGAGSCIFLHIRRTKDASTAGCSAMQENDLRRIIYWLDPAKKPKLLQIPKNYCAEAKSLYPGIACPNESIY